MWCRGGRARAPAVRAARGVAVHWCAPPTPHICDHQNARVGCHTQFDDNPSNFCGAHAATARHCAPHTARLSLRRHRRSLAALPAGRGPPPLLVLPFLPPRARRVEGASGAPAPPPASGPNRRVVFSCGARWQQTRLGILNSPGEQPAGCAAAGHTAAWPKHSRIAGRARTRTAGRRRRPPSHHSRNRRNA